MIYISILIVILAVFMLIYFLAKFNNKIFAILLSLIALSLSIVIIVIKPQMHKEFNLNVIEKIIKINPDGSTTIIKKTTTRGLKNE